METFRKEANSIQLPAFPAKSLACGMPLVQKGPQNIVRAWYPSYLQGLECRFAEGGPTTQPHALEGTASIFNFLHGMCPPSLPYRHVAKPLPKTTFGMFFHPHRQIVTRPL